MSVLLVLIARDAGSFERARLRFHLAQLADEEHRVIQEAFASLDPAVLEEEITPDKALNHEYQRGEYRNPPADQNDFSSRPNHLYLPVGGFSSTEGGRRAQRFFFGWSSAEADQADAARVPAWIARLEHLRNVAIQAYPGIDLPERRMYIQATFNDGKCLAQIPSLLMARARFSQAFRAFFHGWERIPRPSIPSHYNPPDHRKHSTEVLRRGGMERNDGLIGDDEEVDRFSEEVDRFSTQTLRLGEDFLRTAQTFDATLRGFEGVRECPVLIPNPLPGPQLQALIQNTRELIFACANRLVPAERGETVARFPTEIWDFTLQRSIIVADRVCGKAAR